MTEESESKPMKDLGFGWWKAYGWLGLILGNGYIAGFFDFNGGPVKSSTEDPRFIVVLGLMAIYTVTMILVLRFNKFAFLLATILSINPILWGINGMYLKNRWNHPKVNGGK